MCKYFADIGSNLSKRNTTNELPKTRKFLLKLLYNVL